MRARAARLTAAAALVLVAALAGAGTPAASAEDAPYVDWNSLLPAVPQPHHPSREPDCRDGSPRCIEDTLDEMYRRFDRLYASCDHNAVFGITYIRVTEAIRLAVLRGHYEEPAFLNHEDRVFARMYFASYDAWAQGRRGAVPPAWLEAFDSGRARNVNGVGNLLMSMNAHINRDMPFMLEALGLTKPDGSSRKPDHDRGNEVLNALYDDVLAELAARFDPMVDDANAPGSTYDDATIFQILQGWREQVWRHAEMLGAAATPEARRAVAQYIEDYALSTARQIRAGTTISDSSARDAHCAAYRRRHREAGGLGRVRLPRRGFTLRGRGVVRVRVTCPEPVRDCRGTVALARRARRLTAERAFTLRAGRSQVMRVRLTRAWRRRVARSSHTRLKVRGVTASPSPWGTTRRASARTRLRF